MFPHLSSTVSVAAVLRGAVEGLRVAAASDGVASPRIQAAGNDQILREVRDGERDW